MKTALVIGFKKSGYAAAKLLLKHGYHVTLTDLDTQYDEADYKELRENIVFHLGSHPDSLILNHYDIVVKNPGIPYFAPFIKAIAKHHKIITEIELAYRLQQFNHDYVAVTGTNGKTTTVMLIHELLKEHYHNSPLAGNVGTPLSEIVYNESKREVITVELSNFQLLGMPTFHPHISAILNLSPDHLDYMPSLDAYYTSKMAIYQNQNATDYLILNDDDGLLLSYAKNIKSKVLTFSLLHPATAYVENGYIYYNGQPLLNCQKLQLKGEHNVQNIMCAIIVAKLHDMNDATIQKVVYQFKGVKHRLAFVGNLGIKKCYNDSKATTPDATITALKAITEPHYLILGGKDKGLSFDSLKEYMTFTHEVLAYGEIKDLLAKTFNNCKTFETLDEVILYIAKQDNQMSVLFSPGTSSYDQYDNFEKRGEHFEKLIKAGV